MSGGFFDYNHNHIYAIALEIDTVIRRNKVPVQDKDRLGTSDKREFYHDYPDEVIETFKEASELLKKAYAMTNRIDRLLEGDESTGVYLSRLKSDLDMLELTKKQKSNEG